MALSPYDEKYLSKEQQNEVLKLTGAWSETTSPEQQLDIHDQVEAIRATAGYSGGETGMEYIKLPTKEPAVVDATPMETGGAVAAPGGVDTNQLLQQILTAIQTPARDATESPEYQAYVQNIEEQTARATETQQAAVSEEMARRGILRASITVDRLADVAETLGMQAQSMIIEKATEMQTAEDARRSQALSEMQMIFNMAYQVKQDEYNKQLDAIELEMKQQDAAWDRLDRMGYADEETAMILGIPFMTPSAEAKQAALDRSNELMVEQMRLENEKESNFLKIKESNPFYEELPTESAQLLYNNAIDVLTVSPDKYSEIYETMKDLRGDGKITNDEYISVMSNLDKYKSTFKMRAAMVESLKPEEEPEEEPVKTPYYHYLDQVNAALSDTNIAKAKDRVENARQFLMENVANMSDDDYEKLMNHIKDFAETNAIQLER